MNTELTFYPDGTFHCDGLGTTRAVLIGGNKQESGCNECPRFIKCGMSHTSEIATTIKDMAAIKEACKILGLPEPKVGKHTMYDGKKVEGIIIHLKKWQFPIVIDTKSGQIHYDNYNGNWGNIAELQKFRQMYGVAKAKLIAKKQGYFVKQFTLPNGTIRLQVTGM